MATTRPERVPELCASAAAECACGALRRASRAISKLYEAGLAPLDLTATQFSILVAVHRRGPVPLSRLAEGLVLDRTSLYRALKPLIRRRCLRVLPGRTRRERTAELADAGRRLLEEALPTWEVVQRRFVRALGAGAWAALTSGLAQVGPALRALEVGADGSRSGAPRARAPRR